MNFDAEQQNIFQSIGIIRVGDQIDNIYRKDIPRLRKELLKRNNSVEFSVFRGDTERVCIAILGELPQNEG